MTVRRVVGERKAYPPILEQVYYSINNERRYLEELTLIIIPVVQSHMVSLPSVSAAEKVSNWTTRIFLQTLISHSLQSSSPGESNIAILARGCGMFSDSVRRKIRFANL